MKTKFSRILTLFLAFVVQLSFAQEKTITGVVSDENGLPLPSATVLIKNTSNGTSTDFDGNYTINAKNGDIIIFSYVGYSTKEVTVDSNKINVTLDPDNTLEEVVITAGVAGATNRNKLSVTVNSVGAKELTNSPPTSAASALQAKVAGVTVTNFGQPGAGATIQLRGATNLFGGQSPLIIVDGVFVEGGIQDINTDDIASYQIIKGASASALYGSRAGNGVIVIETKKGKKGNNPKVTLRSDVGFSSLNNEIELSNSHNFELASDWQDFQGKYTKYAGVEYAPNYNGVGAVGVISGARIVSEDDYNDNPYGLYNNNQKKFFKNGLDQTLYASVSNASDSNNIFFSAERTENRGVFKETGGYERYGARLNAEFKINEWLKLSARNNYIRTNNETPGGTLDNVLFNLVLQDPDVKLDALNPDGQPYYFIPNPWAATVENPIYDLANNREVARQDRFLGAYNLNIKFSDWLNLDAEYASESTSWRNNDFEPHTTYVANSSTPEGFAYSDGSLSKESDLNTNQKVQFTLNYFDNFGELNVRGKLSYLLENYRYEYFYGQGQNLIYPDVESLDNFVPGDVFIGSAQTEERAKNLFAIIGLDYKDRYILDGMYRIDESSLFGEDQRKNDYYRISGAYRISKDLDIDAIQEMKIHAAYGTAGQRPGFSWQYDQIGLTNGQLSTNRIKSNPNLKPSTTTELEFGLNTDFLDRFTFSGVYSKAKTEDQFMLVDIFPPANAGANKQWQNVGTVEFNTLELSLNANILKNDNLTWDLGLRFEKTENEITELNVNPITVGPTNGNLFRIQEGEEFGAMYGRDFVRSLDQMAAQLPDGESISEYVVNRDGVVVRADAIGTVNESPIILLDENGQTAFKKIGAQTPDFRAGLTSNLNYKGLNFYMLWDWQQGGDIYNRQGQWLTRDNRNALVDQAGLPDSEKKTYTYYQALYDVNQTNGFWVEDGSYVKLREASIFYTINGDKLQNVANGFFDSIRFGITGRNLLTFTDYTGWDPEIQRYDPQTQNYYAVDFGVYPNPTSYTFTFQVKF